MTRKRRRHSSERYPSERELAAHLEEVEQLMLTAPVGTRILLDFDCQGVPGMSGAERRGPGAG